ncbi:hypothetical protein [Propioniferax innocua]|nr:hypothetical protein [Propioniferax innocua]
MTETLLTPLSMPGWPATPETDWFLLFALLVGVPVVLGAVLAMLTLGPWLVRRSRGQSSLEGTEALWLGSAADEDPKELAAEASGEEIRDEVKATADAAAESTGGTSVRW